MKSITIILSLSSLSSFAETAPVTFGTELICSGAIEDHPNEGLRIVLHNQDTELLSPSTEVPRTVQVWLKSQRQGGLWFRIIPSSSVASPKQIFWIYRTLGDEETLLANGTYGASLTLSSGKPLLNIAIPSVKFDIEMSQGENERINLDGYFALKLPNSEDYLIAPKLTCQIQSLVR